MGWRAGMQAHRRTFRPRSHSFWPLLRPMLGLVDLAPCAPHSHIIFFFFEGPKGRYGPREAWAHMGWVGHPAH